MEHCHLDLREQFDDGVVVPTDADPVAAVYVEGYQTILDWLLRKCINDFVCHGF